MSTEINLYADIPADEVSRMRALSDAELRSETAAHQARLSEIQDAVTNEAGELDWSRAQSSLNLDATAAENQAHELSDKVDAGKHMLDKRIEARQINASTTASLPRAPQTFAIGSSREKRAPVKGMFSYLMNQNENTELATEIRDMLQTGSGKSIKIANDIDHAREAVFWNATRNNTTENAYGVDRPLTTYMTTLLNAEKIGAAARLRRVTIPNGGDSWRYRRETSTTDSNIGGTDEAAQPNEATINFGFDTVTVVKRSVTMTVTNEVLDDTFTFMDSVDRIMARDFMQDIENQFVTGSGSGTNMQGMTTLTGKSTGGVLPSNTKILDHIRKNGVIKIQQSTGGNTEASFMLMNLATLDVLMSQKVSSTDDRYIWESAVTGPTNGLILWGVPILVSEKVPANTIILANTSDMFMIEKQGGLTVQVGTTGNDFRDGLRTMLLEYRANFVYERPKSVLDLKVTTS